MILAQAFVLFMSPDKVRWVGVNAAGGRSCPASTFYLTPGPSPSLNTRHSSNDSCACEAVESLPLKSC